MSSNRKILFFSASIYSAPVWNSESDTSWYSSRIGRLLHRKPGHYIG